MAHRHSTAHDIAEIGRLLGEIEGQFGRLARSVAVDAREATGTVPDVISHALVDIADHVREIVRYGARSVGEGASRIGTRTTGAWHKVEDGIVNRPLAALAVAACIGFLIGALNRR
jgi:ElaB/YqjD/DUF883 family membrane-anchored ribosome-binding protein